MGRSNVGKWITSWTNCDGTGSIFKPIPNSIPQLEISNLGGVFLDNHHGHQPLEPHRQTDDLYMKWDSYLFARLVPWLEHPAAPRPSSSCVILFSQNIKYHPADATTFLIPLSGTICGMETKGKWVYAWRK